MNDKIPRWESEKFALGGGVPDDVVCKTCMFRLPPVTVGGKSYERHTYGNCRIYEDTDVKPRGILWEHQECEYYEKG